MIYKGFELSRSLNGTNIVYIGRNAGGTVIFREQSEPGLKKAIDRSIEEKERQTQQLAQEKALQEKNKNQRKFFISRSKREKNIATQKIRRDSTGKFVSKNQSEDLQKKSFWEKLKG